MVLQYIALPKSIVNNLISNPPLLYFTPILLVLLMVWQHVLSEGECMKLHLLAGLNALLLLGVISTVTAHAQRHWTAGTPAITSNSNTTPPGDQWLLNVGAGLLDEIIYYDGFNYTVTVNWQQQFTYSGPLPIPPSSQLEILAYGHIKAHVVSSTGSASSSATANGNTLSDMILARDPRRGFDKDSINTDPQWLPYSPSDTMQAFSATVQAGDGGSEGWAHIELSTNK